MNSYEILKNIHKVGHRVSGVVLEHERFEHQGFVIYHIEVETNSKYKSILIYHSADTHLPLTDNEIPKKGTVIDMVVKNFIDETQTLYLSANPSDMNEAEIRLYEEFYEVIENIQEGTIVQGKISKVFPFGLFIDLQNCSFMGLIDLGHFDFNKGVKLATDFSRSMKEGDNIKCVVSYFRLHGRQIGLGWLPD